MLHVLGEHTGMKNELYQTNVKKSWVYLAPAQVILINACSKSIHNCGRLRRTRLVSPDVCHSIYHIHKAGVRSLGMKLGSLK